VPHHGNAAEVGRRIGQALKTLARKTVVVASTDLTHYSPGYHGADHGPFDRARAWMRGNDGRMAVLIEALRAEDAVAEAGEYENACGAGAVAAALAAARELGARSGRTLEYTTSAEVTGEPDPDYVVGYLAAVLER
jgi:AmmeMemoRadiSam system protein B